MRTPDVDPSSSRMTAIAGARITGQARLEMAADVGRRYEAGGAIRAIAADLGRSYGFVQQLLVESGVPLRSRGGDTRSPAARARLERAGPEQPAQDLTPTPDPTQVAASTTPASTTPAVTTPAGERPDKKKAGKKRPEKKADAKDKKKSDKKKRLDAAESDKKKPDPTKSDKKRATKKKASKKKRATKKSAGMEKAGARAS